MSKFESNKFMSQVEVGPSYSYWMYFHWLLNIHHGHTLRGISRGRYCAMYNLQPVKIHQVTDLCYDQPLLLQMTFY